MALDGFGIRKIAATSNRDRIGAAGGDCRPGVGSKLLDPLKLCADAGLCHRNDWRIRAGARNGIGLRVHI